MKKVILTLLSGVISVWVVAQKIEDSPEFKSGRSAGNVAESKMKKAPKKLLISGFNVHYQLVYTDQDATREGVNIGATSASLVVGFEGIDESQLQAITDELYDEYVKKMEGAGYSIVTMDELSKLKVYQDAQQLKGGVVNYESKGGYASTAPTNFQWMSINGVMKAAKAEVKATQELGAIRAYVNVEIPFMTDSEAGASKLARSALGGVSKVVASPALRIDASKSKNNFQWDVQSTVNTPMKGDLNVSGVFEDEKFKVGKVAVTNVSTQVGHITRVQSWDVSEDQIRVAKCDPDAYLRGVKQVASLYLNTSSDVFLGYATGK